MTALTRTETFPASSGHADASFDLTTKLTTAQAAKVGQLSISYNAQTNSYTLSRDGSSRTFSQSNLVTTGDTGERRYSVKSGDGRSETLTLVDSSYGSNMKTRYVGLGYWQSNSVTGNRQDTVFDTFVYGFPTPATAVPRTGSAQYQTDVFGLTTQVGAEPLTFVGSGRTTFDLDRGKFVIDTNLAEYYLGTGAERSGALYFRASGDLNSSNGGFSGTFQYDGSLDSVGGSLQGQFYGPNAEEAGGVFSGSNGTGSSVVGGFTAGNSQPVTTNTSIVNMAFDQLFYTGESRFFSQQFKDGSPSGYTMASMQNGQLHYDAGEGYRIAGYTDAEGRFVAADIVSSSADPFTIYRKTVDGKTIQLSLYKPNLGPIKLTYSSFGEYYRVTETAQISGINRTYFMYGIDTPEGVLAARTGTATYNGIAYGAAGSSDGLSQLTVTGTSQFLIDFSQQSYAGWLRLQGTDGPGGSSVNFGQFDLVAGQGIFRNAFMTGLTRGGSNSGDIQLRFYGPTGEELSGVFTVAADGYVIGGATASRR